MMKTPRKVNNIFDEIDIFLNSSQRNRWIENDDIKIYLRKSFRFLEYEMRPCIDLATIEVIGELGQGIFSSFLAIFLQLYEDKNIFVESILSERFSNFFKRHEFKYTKDSSPLQTNMYLLKTKFK